MRILHAIAAIVCTIAIAGYAPPHATFGPEYLSSGDTIRVDIDTACNVFAVDEYNYRKYLRGESFHYFGGAVERSPYYITPGYGYYYVVIDNGGGSIRGIRAGVQVLRGR